MTVFSWSRAALLALVSFAMVACAAPQRGAIVGAPAPVERFAEGLVWQLDHPDFPTAYLVGTQHVDGPGVTAVVQTASLLLPDVDLVALEVDMDPPDDIAPLVWQHFADIAPPFLDQELDPRLWNFLARQGDEIGVPAARLRLLSPTGAAFIFSNELSPSGPRPSDYGVDARLADLAVENQVQVIGLESHEEALFSLFRLGDWVDRWIDPDAIVGSALLQTVLSDTVGVGQPRRLNPTASAAYASEDIGYFAAVSFGDTSGRSPAARDLQRVTRDHLLVDRNYRFIDRMLRRLPDGPMLVAVGAAHLPGPEGMLELLAARGFEATRIPLAR